MKVAIADDDAIVCSSLSTILTATGAAEVIWTAGDGAEAMAKYESGPAMRPDVLLLDVQMPGTDGLAAAEQILAFDPAARILFLTTFADRDYISRAMALGAKGYLIKQDVASVAPALQAVMAGQVVLGSEVLGKLTATPPQHGMTGAVAGDTGDAKGTTPALRSAITTWRAYPTGNDPSPRWSRRDSTTATSPHGCSSPKARCATASATSSTNCRWTTAPNWPSPGSTLTTDKRSTWATRARASPGTCAPSSATPSFDETNVGPWRPTVILSERSERRISLPR